MTSDEQYQLVYQGICEVAARCDGAQSLDYKGFDGQDTHFGRRIASVPFAQWTQAVKEDAARIANKYQKQILAYTGVDVSILDVVKAAKDQATNHQGRNDARGYEKRAATLAARKIDLVAGQLGIFYDRKDPDFSVLLDACKALPGRQFDWTRKCNVVPPSQAVDDFILTWDFPLTPAAQALLTAPRAIKYAVTLAGNGQKVIIDTPYDPALVEAIRSLPGRSWDGARKINTADAHPKVLALVAQFKLSVHPDAQAACEGAKAALEATQAAALAQEDISVVLAHVSRQRDPGALPDVFIQLLEEVLHNA